LMPTDKPARQYTKLISELKALQRRNGELETESLRTASRIQYAIEAALESTRADHDETRRQVTALRKELDTAMTSLATITAERDEAQNKLLAATVRADSLAAQVADIQPQLDLIEQQRVDLTHILDAVRERMRRREQQGEQAILNRRALASAAPRKNWG
jgi:predicted  nucleic acid-binding Zn-ribbon protein